MRIMVADDHDLVRETLAAFLQSEGVGQVKTASSLSEALDLVNEFDGFDLVLLDYNMPDMQGLEGLDRMIDANNGKPVALLSGTATRAIAEEALKNGAAGFVPKTLSSKSMISAAKFMAAGEIYAPMSFIQPDASACEAELTPREKEVLQGLCEGKSNKEIARDLDLQEVTIKLHVKTLSRKLEARNRTHAAMIGRERQLV